MSKTISRSLSRYQATFLAQLPMGLAALQGVKQTCVRASYIRKLIEISKAGCRRTPLGSAILKEYRGEAHINRAESMQYADFTSVLRDLSAISQYMAKIDAQKKGHGLRIMPPGKRAAA